MWGPLGNFSPDCPESLISGPMPLWAVSPPVWSFADWTWTQEQLRSLRAIPLEVPLLPTVIANPSLSTWAPLGTFLRLSQNGSDNELSDLVATNYLKTDLVHMPVLVAYSGYLIPTE